MGRYDNERQLMGLSPLGVAPPPTLASPSRYATERQAIFNPPSSVSDWRKQEDTNTMPDIPAPIEPKQPLFDLSKFSLFNNPPAFSDAMPISEQTPVNPPPLSNYRMLDNASQAPERPSLLSRFAKGFWDGGIKTAAEGYKQDGLNILYAAQKEAEARDARLGITPNNGTEPYLSSLPNRSDLPPISQPKTKDYGAGNIDLNNRPIINNPDGSKSTVYSMTFTNDDGSALLLPGVRAGLDRKMTPQEAMAWYQKTGEYLGKFKTDAEAEAYANTLHEDQANQYIQKPKELSMSDFRQGEDTASVPPTISKSPKSYLNPLANSADLKAQYDKLQADIPYQPTDTAGKIGNFVGNLVGNAPAFAVGGAATEGIAQDLIAKLGPTLAEKLAPSLIPYAEKSVQGALGFAPFGLMESNSLQDIPKNVAESALTGAVLSPALHGLGEGFKLGKDVLNNGGSLKQALAERTLEPYKPISNPLQDVQNAYQTPSLRDTRTQQYNDIFNDTSKTFPTEQQQTLTPTPLKELRQLPLQRGIDNAIGIKVPLSPLERSQRQDDLSGAFKGLPNRNAYSLTTGEQRALSELQDGIQTAQNYIGHNDVLAGYPAGTTIPQAYADIAKNTGVDLPKLMSNWDKTQTLKTSLTPDELVMGRTAGVIPKLAPRKSWTDMVPQEVIEPPSIQSTLAEPKTLRIWTNRDNIPIANPEPIRPMPQQTLQDVLKSRETQPITSNEAVTPAIGQPKVTPAIDPVNAKMPDASAHPVAEHIMSKLDDIEASARARIASNKGRLNAGLPVDTLADYSIIGGVKIARGAVKYSVWAADMVNDLGNSIKPHLQEIWQESNKQHSLMVDGTFDHSLPEPQSKIIIGKEKDPFSFKNAWNKFYTGVVDAQKPIGDFSKVAGDDTSKLASNTKNISGIVDHNFLTAMVDKNGDKVGESLKSTVEAIPKGEEKDFWTYMSQRHNIDRAREESHQVPRVDKQGFAVKDRAGNPLYDTVIDKKPTPVQANYTPSMSADAVKIAEQAHPEYKAIGDGITNWIDKFMQTWGVDTGIVNKDVYAGLRDTYKSYFPTQREFSTLESSIPDGLTAKFADQRTPIRKATGSERDIKDPIENIMNLVSKVVRTAKYNEVGQNLLDTIRSNPEKMKQFAEVIPTKDGMFANTDNIITVLEDGKPTYLKINNKPLLDAMNGLPKSVGNIPVLSAMTNAFKSLITQKNPIFAIRNISRDVPTAYVNGSESNPFKFGKDLIGAGKDILTNSPRLQKYQAVGGGGANFFSPGDVAQSAAELIGKKPTLKEMALHPLKTLGESKPIRAVETFNNLTETAPRLAEFNRVLDKTGDVTKALAAANDVTVNFSRGGNITKSVDRGVPYLNAGVQGLDRFVRSFINPKTAIATIIKSGVAITAPDLALYMVNKDNPNYQKLDNRAKDTYFMIPNLTDKDQNGNAKTFIPIPKSRELGVLFGSLFERGLRAAEGQKDSFKGFGNAIKTSFAPTNPFDSNFLSPVYNAFYTNKDFANRPIVPQPMIMDKRSDYLQYDEKTTSIAKAIGELSRNIPGLPGGISPKQLDYLVKSYTGVVGQFGIPLAVPGGSPLKALKAQFIKDPLFSNQATTDFYDKLDQLSAAATDKNIIQKIPSKTLTPEENMRNSMNGISSALSRGNKLINTVQASSDPLKDDKIKAIKTQILNLTGQAVSADTPKLMQLVENGSKKLFLK